MAKIPTATLRELLIFNEAYGMREKIWGPVDDMPQLHEKDEASTPTQSKDLRDIVSSIFSKFRDTKQAGKGKAILKANKNKHSWLSRCLVLVLDTQNRLILTGGTKPICQESSLFRQAVKTIADLRIGEEFAKIIHNRSKEFADRAIKMTQSESIQNTEQLSGLKASEIEELKFYDRVVNEDKSDWYGSIPAPTKSKPILSWACEGSTFEFKPPCLRCQSIYPTWVLHQKPADEDGRKENLIEWVFAHLVPENPRLDMNWAYCAQTIVAAKLFLLSNGTFSLV